MPSLEPAASCAALCHTTTKLPLLSAATELLNWLPVVKVFTRNSGPCGIALSSARRSSDSCAKRWRPRWRRGASRETIRSTHLCGPAAFDTETTPHPEDGNRGPKRWTRRLQIRRRPFKHIVRPVSRKVAENWQVG